MRSSSSRSRAEPGAKHSNKGGDFTTARTQSCEPRSGSGPQAVVRTVHNPEIAHKVTAQHRVRASQEALKMSLGVDLSFVPL